MNLEWYGVKTFPGYEYKVQERLEKLIKKDGLEEQIVESFIPTYKTYSFVRKDIKLKEELIFPGYVFIKMNLTNEIMYSVRGVQYIIGYAGVNEQKQKPDVITIDEIKKMQEDSRKLYTTLDVGSKVLFTDGFEEEEVIISSFNLENETLDTENGKTLSFDKIKKIK